MNIVLSVYTKSAFKEYILPSLNNSDYSIVLYKDYFHIHEDVCLELEILDYEWKFKSNHG